MDRRTFMGATAAAAASSVLAGTAHAQSAPKAKNVVLVHGLFADGSCWSEVIPRLQAAGLNVSSVQNPSIQRCVCSPDRMGRPSWSVTRFRE